MSVATDDGDLDSSAVALRERQKELRCLYRLNQLIATCGERVEDLLAGVPELLPPSWLYPEVAAARLRIDGRDYCTQNFRPTDWRLGSALPFAARHSGSVEVVYLDARPGRDEGPFLREERELLDAVAHQTAMAISHAEYQLAIRHQGHVLRQAVDRADQQTQLNHQVADNVHRVLMPIVRDLEHSLSHAQRQKVDMLRRSLGELNSPLVRHLSQRFPALTPSELRICEAIRQGLSSKEISRVEGIAVGTANRYREKIRRKLKLTGKPVNLAAFLRNACRKS